jgi:ferredoxin
MVLNKDTLLYFSGTGNSLQVAKDINFTLKDFQLCNISSVVKEEKIIIKGKVLGIIFPVIYARLPLILERVIGKLEVNKDVYVFAVATHGGAPAEVLTKLSKILNKKGIVLNAGFLVHMPGNNILSYGAYSLKTQNNLFEKERMKIREISNIVKDRRSFKCESSKLLIDTLIDRLFIKTTDKIVENLKNRDKDFWVNDNCNGCMLCEKICTVNNIQIQNGTPVWKHNCEQCTACIQYCPQQAIQWQNRTAKRNRYRNPNVKVTELMKTTDN